jgi:6-pyruvoyltetrahydropterin/6-carboxytetrahydropterin synthase
MFELTQSFYFEAAHTLRREIEPEGSRRIHGHTYHTEITISGMPNPITGMITDLSILRAEIERVRQKLDHQFLDEVDGLGPATLENLCRFMHQQLREVLPSITAVVVERRASGDRCSMRLDCPVNVSTYTHMPNRTTNVSDGHR